MSDQGSVDNLYKVVLVDNFDRDIMCEHVARNDKNEPLEMLSEEQAKEAANVYNSSSPEDSDLFAVVKPQNYQLRVPDWMQDVINTKGEA